MTFDLEIDGKPFHIHFYRDQFWGTAYASVNGEVQKLASAFSPFTHFSFKRTREYTVELPDSTEVFIVKTRPRFLAGPRPQRYTAYHGGRTVAEYQGI